MTTTDDLRTRARRAAARVYPFDGTDPNAVIALRSAYVHGFLAAYEQLPGWEEIAREVAYWAPTWDDAGSIADVALALIRGAEVERLREYIDRMPYPSDMDELRADRDRLAATVERVRELHQPRHIIGDHYKCDACDVAHPCSTIAAIEGADS